MKARRLRRSAEEARLLILDAAEKRLEESGPGGLRLQEIARDAGISHSTILHHFGSREALVEAVVGRALERVQRDVAGAFTNADFAPQDAARLLHGIGRRMGRGHARLIAWLALEGGRQVDPGHILRAMADVMHARRIGEHGAGARADDTRFIVVLTAFVILAEGIVRAARVGERGTGGRRAGAGAILRVAVGSAEGAYESAGRENAKEKTRQVGSFHDLAPPALHGDGIPTDEARRPRKELSRLAALRKCALRNASGLRPVLERFFDRPTPCGDA